MASRVDERARGYRIRQRESNNLSGPFNGPNLPLPSNRVDRKPLTELRAVTGFPPLESPRCES